MEDVDLAAAQQGVAADELVGRPSAALWRSQLNAGTLIWNDLSSSNRGFSSHSDHLLALVFLLLGSGSERVNGRGGRVSTVDHADIRGSALAAFMVTIRRELPRTGLAGLAAQRTRGFSTVGRLDR